QADVMRAGSTIFQSTTRHFGVLLEEGTALAARALLIVAVVTAFVVGARSFSGPDAAAVAGAMPILTAGTPHLGPFARILVLTGPLAAAGRLLALERRLPRLRTGDAKEPGTEMD